MSKKKLQLSQGELDECAHNECDTACDLKSRHTPGAIERGEAEAIAAQVEYSLVKNDGSEAQKDWPALRIDSGRGVTVAEVFGSENEDLGRVFAAGPDLLAALRLCYAELRRFKKPDLAPSELALGLAEEAIAKAEGGSK